MIPVGGVLVAPPATTTIREIRMVEIMKTLSLDNPLAPIVPFLPECERVSITIGSPTEITYSQMYAMPDAPSLPLFESLREYFGADRVQEKPYGKIENLGCESCDFGSDYGYTLEVFGATRNMPSKSCEAGE